MQTLTTAAELDDLLQRPIALLYKHSTRCPISAAAHEEVRAYVEAYPDAPVWLLDVNAQRALSDSVVARTGVDHHSPQAILLVGGRAAWSASHFDVRFEALERKLAEAGA